MESTGLGPNWLWKTRKNEGRLLLWPRFGYLDGWCQEADECVEDDRRLDPGIRPGEHLRG